MTMRAEHPDYKALYDELGEIADQQIWRENDITQEMPILNETLRTTPETQHLSPGEQQLLEAITFPAEMQMKMKVQFENAISKELDSYVDPNDKKLIQKVASIIEWEWFAGPGDPLPAGVAVNSRGNLMSKSKHVAANQERVKNHLNTNVLDKLLRLRSYLFEELGMDTAVREACSVMSKESETYKFLHALASDIPESADVPLTASKRMIREAQIEESVRREFGLERDDSFRIHNGAHNTLQRRLYQLDDETERRDTSQQLDSRQRVLQFIVNEYNRHYGCYDDGPIAGFYFHDGEVYGSGVEGDVFFPGDYICDLSQSVAEDICNVGGSLEYFADNKFILYYLLPKLLDIDESSKTVQELLDESTYGASYEEVFWNGKFDTKVLIHLRGVQSEVISTEGIPVATWLNDDSNIRPEVHNEQMVRDQQENVIGRVYKGASLAANHLILTGNVSPDSTLPQEVGEYDMLLTIDSTAKKFMRIPAEAGHTVAGVPFVPGFELVAHGIRGIAKEYYYKQTETDPYNGSAHVEIEPNHIQALIQQCERIGFTSLADKLDGVDELSLADLVSLVRESSDYTFNKKYWIFTYPKDKFTDEQLKQLINENGRLQVQCTGAAVSLGVILETALPGSNSIQIGGNIIDSRGEISQAEHAQTMISYRGEQYIVDATPKLRRSGGTDEHTSNRGGVDEHVYQKQAEVERTIKHEGSDNVSRLTGAIKVNEFEVKHLEVTSTTQEQRQEQIEKRVENVGESAKNILRGYFNLSLDSSDDELYTHVLKLKKDADPIRKTMELVLRSETEDITNDLESVQEYISNLKKADPSIFKRIGIPRYDQTTLNTLESILKDLKLRDTLQL